MEPRNNEFISQIRQYYEDNPFEAEAALSESYGNATELADRLFPEDGRRLREEELAELEALEARAARNRPAPMLRPQEMPGGRIPGNVHSTDMRGLYAGVQNLAAALVNRKRQRRMLGDPEALAEAKKERAQVAGNLARIQRNPQPQFGQIGLPERGRDEERGRAVAEMRGRSVDFSPASNPRETGQQLADMGVSLFGENRPPNTQTSGSDPEIGDVRSVRARQLRERLGELDRTMQESRGVLPQLRELRTRQQQARMNAERRADFVGNAQEQLFNVRRDEASDRRSMFGDLIQEQARGQTAVTRAEAQGEQQRRLEGMRQEGRTARDEQQFENELEKKYVEFGLSQREAVAEAERISNGGNPNTSINYSIAREFINSTPAGARYNIAKQNMELLQRAVANNDRPDIPGQTSLGDQLEAAQQEFFEAAEEVNREWAQQFPSLSSVDVTELNQEDDEDDAFGLPETVRNPNRDPAPADSLDFDPDDPYSDLFD